MARIWDQDTNPQAVSGTQRERHRQLLGAAGAGSAADTVMASVLTGTSVSVGSAAIVGVGVDIGAGAIIGADLGAWLRIGFPQFCRTKTCNPCWNSIGQADSWSSVTIHQSPFSAPVLYPAKADPTSLTPSGSAIGILIQ